MTDYIAKPVNCVHLAALVANLVASSPHHSFAPLPAGIEQALADPPSCRAAPLPAPAATAATAAAVLK